MKKKYVYVLATRNVSFNKRASALTYLNYWRLKMREVKTKNNRFTSRYFSKITRKFVPFLFALNQGDWLPRWSAAPNFSFQCITRLWFADLCQRSDEYSSTFFWTIAERCLSFGETLHVSLTKIWYPSYVYSYGELTMTGIKPRILLLQGDYRLS